jgi:hypothetical protein
MVEGSASRGGADAGAGAMSAWGDTVPLPVTIPARLSHTGLRRHAVKAIDRGVADLVGALNRAVIVTVASCDGHGGPGRIDLEDGRVLVVRHPGEQG